MTTHPYRDSTHEPPTRRRFWWFSWHHMLTGALSVAAFNLGTYAFDSCSRPSMPMRDRLEDEAKRHLTRTHPGARVNVACAVVGGEWGTCNGAVDGRQIQPMTCVPGDGCR